VPWRLRKLSTGDVVPEVIPLGLFTWSIESIPNRVPRKANNSSSLSSSETASSAKFSGPPGARISSSSVPVDKHQMAAERSFQKQKAYFSDPKRVPYPLQGDVMRMGNRSDQTKGGEKQRLKGFAEEHKKQNHPESVESEEPDEFSSQQNKRRRADENTPAFYR